LAARPSKDAITARNQAATHEFWEYLRDKYTLYVSDYFFEECEKGDTEASKKRLSFLEGIEILKKTPEIEPLTDVYMRLLSIPQRNIIDARHLAICCIYGIDILLSWNCTHLGVESMRIAEKYNDAHGFSTPLMVAPDYLITKYKEADFDE
jgi:hypothetical protein